MRQQAAGVLSDRPFRRPSNWGLGNASKGCALGALSQTTTMTTRLASHKQAGTRTNNYDRHKHTEDDGLQNKEQR
eukprot:8823005-Alexandrium_andersonii.AAC.1